MTGTKSIGRRWPDTIVFAAIGLGLLAWSAVLLRSTLVGGALAGLFGLMSAALAVMGPASGPCPLCGKTLHGLFIRALRTLERCPHCRAYFRCSDGKEVPEDHVAQTPCFSVPVGRGERLPGLCCVCAAPAERVKEIVHRSRGRVSHISPVAVRMEMKVPVPYCGRHDGGVSIVSEDLSAQVPILEAMTGGSSDHRMVLKVRSYRFYRAALAA